jgi:Methylase involved in ubiquinone/menaquinone biosynthesis
MKLPGYYSSGQFAHMANVSLRTIRFYDKQNILKPSYVTPSGARFYTDSDFAGLQQILLLKYLGFSLKDIREMTIHNTDNQYMMNSLNIQKQLIQDRIEQMQLVESAIENTMLAIQQNQRIDWSQMLELIHLTSVQKNLKTQYQNAANISARINLHKNYSLNKQGWFPWIYEQCHITNNMKILEIGCGSGALWTENFSRLPDNVEIVLSDISEGMIRDVRRSIGLEDSRFSFQVFDCAQIPFPDNSFDLVIANHMLFYCDDISKICKEIRRVLNPKGKFLGSTYGNKHMKEISLLVQRFDSHIALSDKDLYQQFGLENGRDFLEPFFKNVSCIRYEDEIYLNTPGPLIDYILSCHGNQKQILLDRYSEFYLFVENRVKNGFRITKDAGVFYCSV